MGRLILFLTGFMGCWTQDGAGKPVEELLAEVRELKGWDSEILRKLAALGKKAIPHLERHSDDENEDIVRAAFIALGWIPEPEIVFPILAKRIDGEKSDPLHAFWSQAEKSEKGMREVRKHLGVIYKILGEN